MDKVRHLLVSIGIWLWILAILIAYSNGVLWALWAVVLGGLFWLGQYMYWLFGGYSDEDKRIEEERQRIIDLLVEISHHLDRIRRELA